MQREARNMDDALRFSFSNGEGDSGCFVVEPFGDQADKPSTLQLEVAMRHSLANTGGYFLAKHTLHMPRHERLCVWDCEQVLKRMQAMRFTPPNRMHDCMEKLSALTCGQSCFGWCPTLRGQSRGGECLEGALRLRREDTRSTLDSVGREGNERGVVETDGAIGLNIRWRKLIGKRFWQTGKLYDEPGRACLSLSSLFGVTEMHGWC